MTLKELFEHRINYILNEDNKFIGSQVFDDQEISFDIAHSILVGSFNGLEIWGSKHLGPRYDMYGILTKNREVLSWCIFDIKMHPGFSTFIRAFTKKEHRGKDLTLTIINFMVEKTKEKILIDKNESTSSDSRKMINKWANYSNVKRHFTIKVLDKDKKEIDVSLDSVLIDHSINDNYLLFETISDKIYPSTCGVGRRILSDWIWY